MAKEKPDFVYGALNGELQSSLSFFTDQDVGASILMEKKLRSNQSLEPNATSGQRYESKEQGAWAPTRLNTFLPRLSR
jgi:hypothetical protein